MVVSACLRMMVSAWLMRVSSSPGSASSALAIRSIAIAAGRLGDFLALRVVEAVLLPRGGELRQRIIGLERHRSVEALERLVCASELPLNGMWFSLMPAADWNASIVRWLVDPTPSDDEEFAATSDPVISKAKTTIAAKLEDPASAEFGEMKRAARKNMLGKSVDTICGLVKGKKASGEDTGATPFLYLVTEDEEYVVDGPANSAAASAYRNICSS